MTLTFTAEFNDTSHTPQQMQTWELVSVVLGVRRFLTGPQRLLKLQPSAEKFDSL